MLQQVQDLEVQYDIFSKLLQLDINMVKIRLLASTDFASVNKMISDEHTNITTVINHGSPGQAAARLVCHILTIWTIHGCMSLYGRVGHRKSRSLLLLFSKFLSRAFSQLPTI